MIAVETVIRKLVSEYEFVIIPGFGALLSHQIPADYDDASQSFSPPAKKLAFNAFLKLDDGLLANYISRHESLSHVEAVDHVKKYADLLHVSLENKGEAAIAGIGEFRKNVEGKLVFEPNTGKYFKDEWYGFEKVKASKIHSLAAPALATSNVIEEDSVEVFESEEIASSPFQWGRWAAAAVIAAILCGLSLFFVNSKNGNIQSTLNPFTELFSKYTAVDPAQQTVAVVDEPVTETKIEAVPMPDSTVITPAVATPAAKASVTKIEPAKVNTVKSLAPVSTPAAVSVVSAKFYVIAGTFKGMRQAKILLAELKEKGFADATILIPGKAGKKVKVATNGYDTETDAYHASKTLKGVIGEAGWVYEKR